MGLHSAEGLRVVSENMLKGFYALPFVEGEDIERRNEVLHEQWIELKQIAVATPGVTVECLMRLPESISGSRRRTSGWVVAHANGHPMTLRDMMQARDYLPVIADLGPLQPNLPVEMAGPPQRKGPELITPVEVFGSACVGWSTQLLALPLNRIGDTQPSYSISITHQVGA